MKSLLISTIIFFSVNTFAKIDSAYTNVDVKSCVTVDSDQLYAEPEIDFYNGECPAFGGYRVNISGGDIRYSLDLSYNGVEIATVKMGAFHDIGSDKIEWRFERTGSWANKKVEYKALIYRLNYTTYDVNGDIGAEDMLVVVRLKGENSCVIGKIKQQANMNNKARALADNMNAACIAL